MTLIEAGRWLRRRAEDVAVLDAISGGRFTLGVAPGYVSEEFAAHDIPRKERTRRRLEEFLGSLGIDPSLHPTGASG